MRLLVVKAQPTTQPELVPLPPGLQVSRKDVLLCAGASGLTGASGATGTTGSTGAAGTNGASPTGPVVNGATGATSDPGASGPTGVDAVTGEGFVSLDLFCRHWWGRALLLSHHLSP